MKALIQKIDATDATEFQKIVWKELCAIPKGKVLTYTELAQKVGRPSAVRAVANACGKNPFAPDVPCHRVVRNDGGLGGYSGAGGVSAKKKLLQAEGAL
jgi:methylated-DNA-[protein]-cysteine S-methyltransferase